MHMALLEVLWLSTNICFTGPVTNILLISNAFRGTGFFWRISLCLTNDASASEKYLLLEEQNLVALLLLKPHVENSFKYMFC